MMLKQIIARIKNVWASPERQRLLEKQLAEANQRIKGLEDLMAEHLTIGVDLGFTPGHVNYAVVIGRYRGHDYVRTFHIHDEGFNGVVNALKDLDRRHGSPSKFIDAPPTIARHIKWELDHDL